MKSAFNFFSKKISGFTLVELMIAVGIIAILSAFAIPAYISYIRRSYLSEATSSISNIKSAEESYFSTNGCYVAAPVNPSTVPNAISAAWDTGATNTVWGTSGLSVRPDRTVRFQYAVYADNSWSASSACAGASATSGAPFGSGYSDRDATVNCVNGNFLIPSTVFGATASWYFVVARGNLDGDGEFSTIVSAVDDSKIYNCNELE